MKGIYRFITKPFSFQKHGELYVYSTVNNEFDPCYQDFHMSHHWFVFIVFELHKIIKTGIHLRSGVRSANPGW